MGSNTGDGTELARPDLEVPLSFLAFGSERRAASKVAKPQSHVCAALRDGKRLETQVVLGKGNFAMSASAIATCAKVLLDRRAVGDSLSGVHGIEGVFKLSEVQGGFEDQGIRIEAVGWCASGWVMPIRPRPARTW